MNLLITAFILVTYVMPLTANDDNKDDQTSLWCSAVDGNSVLACDPSNPFTCYTDGISSSPVSCTDERCKVGSSCRGVGGADGDVVRY